MSVDSSSFACTPHRFVPTSEDCLLPSSEALPGPLMSWVSRTCPCSDNTKEFAGTFVPCVKVSLRILTPQPSSACVAQWQSIRLVI
eukprot:4742525-Amphidinium_carterae.1